MNQQWIDFWTNYGFKIVPETNGQLLVRKTDSEIAYLEVDKFAWNLTMRKSEGTYGTNRISAEFFGHEPDTELAFAFMKFRAFYGIA